MRTEILLAGNHEKLPEYVHNFFELDETRLEVLKERIKKFDGLVRLFVHPYFITADEEEDGFSQQKLNAINRAINILATNDPAKVPPLMIMEGQEKLPVLAENIQEFNSEFLSGHPKFRDVYIIPTRAGNSPEPAPVNKIDIKPSANDDGDIREYESDANWSVLTAKLKQLGVKKILIGGMLMEAVKMTDDGKLKGVGCVGATIRHLQDDFKVELSNLSYSRAEWDEDVRDNRRKFQQELKR